MSELEGIKWRLLDLDPDDVWLGLLIADQIKGLKTAGASGLLALFYPKTFGTVDQFAVKALREIADLPEAGKIAKMRLFGWAPSRCVRHILGKRPTIHTLVLAASRRENPSRRILRWVRRSAVGRCGGCWRGMSAAG